MILYCLYNHQVNADPVWLISMIKYYGKIHFFHYIFLLTINQFEDLQYAIISTIQIDEQSIYSLCHLKGMVC